MKMITTLAIAVLLGYSCKKKDPVTPQPAPDITKKQEWLHIFRVIGFIDRNKSTGALECDTASLSINGNLFSNTCYGYNFNLKAGDKLSYYYSGDLPDKDANCNFSIWKNENELPTNSLRTFNALRKIFTKDSIMHRDSLTIAKDTVHYTVDTTFITRIWARLSGSMIVE